MVTVQFWQWRVSTSNRDVNRRTRKHQVQENAVIVSLIEVASKQATNDSTFQISFLFFFYFPRSKISLDHWPKPFKVRMNTLTALQIQERGRIIRVLFPNPLRKSKQHFTAHHFFNAHKSRMVIPILTFSAASTPVRRCLSNWNLLQCQIKWCTVS
jgi:hypothetical protein